MQTFLPFADFARSAACLDRQRLGKQRLEVQSILNALRVPGAGWANHPATKMWRGYELALCKYGDEIIREWTSRGYRNNMPHFNSGLPCEVFVSPHWLGDERFHSAHRAALLAKNPDWYSQFNWEEQPKIDYWWPV
jgi:hypothetical protein